MPRARKAALPADQVRGLKHLRRVFSLMQSLHDDATARDKAHNRTLFYDPYAGLVLMSLFSPAVDSLRAIIQASVMPKVRKLLGCSKVSLGSLSEAARVFDPQLLLEVIAELSKDLLPLATDARLKDIQTTLTLCDGTRRQYAGHPLRLIEVHAEVQPRTARGEGKPKTPAKTEVLLIATNLLDVPAEVVALVYRYRWTIELFFRFFKQILGCRHLLSDDPNGIPIQCYCAVIACMLLQLWTGHKPSKEMHRLIHFYLCGWADEADVVAWLNRPDNTGIKKRARDELWKKLGVN